MDDPQTWQQVALEWLPIVLASLGSLAGVFLLGFGARAWMDGRIREILMAPESLSAIAGRIRPSIVFDTCGSIIADQGGMRLIESIDVKPDEEGGLHAGTITVVTKEWAASIPLLQALDKSPATLSSHRGLGRTITYTLEYDSRLLVEDSVEATLVQRYRLEFLTS